MRIGVVFPQTEIGDDPVLIRDFAQTVEGLGYTHLLVYDHVARRRAGATPRTGAAPTTPTTPFHEPFVLFGYLAGLTERIELVTGVLVLPQRQTALVAKQAAEVDVLSGGRLRLGVGVGWNDGRVRGAGRELPRPGTADRGADRAAARALDRTGRSTSQGRWRPRPGRRHQPAAGAAADPDLDRRPGRADAAAGRRDWATAGSRRCFPTRARRRCSTGCGTTPPTPAATRTAIGIEPRIEMRYGDPATWPALIEGWRGLGATHLAIGTTRPRPGPAPSTSPRSSGCTASW